MLNTKSQKALYYILKLKAHQAKTVGISVLLLSGCQSTGVVPMGQDSYYIGKKDGSPGLGVSLGNKAAVYREADAFCRGKGLEFKAVHETVTPASPGHLGSTELQFSCVPINESPPK